MKQTFEVSQGQKYKTSLTTNPNGTKTRAADAEKGRRKGKPRTEEKRRSGKACVQSCAFTAREDTHDLAVQDKALSASQKSAYLIRLNHPHKTKYTVTHARTPNRSKHQIREPEA